MIPPELLTIRDFLRYAVTQFNSAGLYFGHGTDNAWDEAVALLIHTLHLPLNVDNQVLDARLTAEEKAKLNELIQLRLSKRIPLAYITHEAHFANQTFYVDERVIIPRSSIAELILDQFQPWIEENQVNDILDLCTGSACIAIACAKAFPNAEIDASDISSNALVVAKMNVLRHQLEDQVHLYESDLFDRLPKKKYDIIVSNPPYVSQAEMETLPAEYLHEPKMSLAAGVEGLDFAVRILQEAKKYLKPNGILVVEVGNSDQALAETYPDIPFTWLEFSNGEGGVFLLTAEQCEQLPF